MLHLRRRKALTAAVSLLATAPRAWSQPGVPLIGYLTADNPEPALGYFRAGLERLGYAEGRNIRIVLRSADGRVDQLPGLAAKSATRQIPIIITGSGDPVGVGLVASLSRPGGNITGTASTAAEVGGKLLEVIREALPAARRVAVLVNGADSFGKLFLGGLQGAGRSLGVQLSAHDIGPATPIEGVMAELGRKRPDALVVQPSLPLRRAAALALQHRLPAFASNGVFTSEGGLMSYAASQEEMNAGAAVLLDKVLKGAKPADLPVQQPTRYELVINQKTARALGLAVPRALLLRADRVIG